MYTPLPNEHSHVRNRPICLSAVITYMGIRNVWVKMRRKNRIIISTYTIGNGGIVRFRTDVPRPYRRLSLSRILAFGRTSPERPSACEFPGMIWRSAFPAPIATGFAPVIFTRRAIYFHPPLYDMRKKGPRQEIRRWRAVVGAPVIRPWSSIALMRAGFAIRVSKCDLVKSERPAAAWPKFRTSTRHFYLAHFMSTRG